MRSARSVVLGLLSMCGSLAAAVWLATSGVASAETLYLESPVRVVDEVSTGGAVISKLRIVVVRKPTPLKEKWISLGAFEGY